jgi:hypothetical protein
MPPAAIFNLQLAMGYVPWLLCFSAYGWPRLRAMAPLDAQRAIAALHAFRFFGLVFILPGVVGPSLPPTFAVWAAWGDFATGLLAMAAMMAVRVRPLFWALVVAFNVTGLLDILIDYYNGVMLGLPALSGQLAATYVIPIIYVPILTVTHVAAFMLLARSAPKAAASVARA